MRKRLAFPLFLTLLAAMPSAHSQITSDQTQDQTTDCSDPANASSALCNGNQGNIDLGGFGQAGAFGQAAERNVPSGAPLNTRTYTDLGNGTTANRSDIRQPLTIPVPPEPLTEFQKYVAGTTGEVLPIFGANLFRDVPSTFAPVEQIPVTPDYLIGPGDELRVRVWGQVNFNADVRVDRSGNVYLPQVGAVHVAGMQFSALDQHLRTEIGRVFRNFDLTVDAGQLRSIQVFVVGQARRPGTYTVSSLSTLVNALFASGGPSSQGSLRHILVKRQGATITDFDLYDLLVRGDKSKDVQLLPGDVIFIPPVGTQVALTGSVRHPAIFEVRDETTTIQQLLADAGHRITMSPTTGPGTADGIARKAIENGSDLIIAAGGDGTLNEVMNGMVHTAVPLAILPAGTANVLATELGLGRNPAHAAAMIPKLVGRRIAVGRLDCEGRERHSKPA